MPVVALVSSQQWSSDFRGASPSTRWGQLRPAAPACGWLPASSPAFARDLLHAFVLGLLATIATFVLVVRPLALHAPASAPEARTAQPAAPAPVEVRDAAVSPAGLTTPTGSFAPRVERWRALAGQAAERIAAAEGVAIEPDLLLALVQTESSGDPDAVSDADAVGLVQVRAPAFADMVRRYPRLFPQADRRDPYENLLAGGLYLAFCARVLGADLADESGIAAALNAYNYGPSALLRLNAADAPLGPLPRETQLHAARVLASYAAISTARLAAE